MAEIQQTFNSQEFTFADISIMVGGQIIANPTAVDYTETAKKTPIYGKSVYPVAIQRGQRSFSGNLSMFQSDFETLLAMCPNRDLLSITVDIIIVYGNPERGDVLITDVLQGVEFTEYQKSLSNQDDNMTVQLPFICLNKKAQVPA